MAPEATIGEHKTPNPKTTPSTPMLETLTL